MKLHDIKKKKKRSFAGVGFPRPWKASLTLKGHSNAAKKSRLKTSIETWVSLSSCQPRLLSVTALLVQHFSVLSLMKRQDMSTRWTREKLMKKPSVSQPGMQYYPPIGLRNNPIVYLVSMLHSYPFLRNFSLKIRLNLFFFLLSGLQIYLNLSAFLWTPWLLCSSSTSFF